MSYIIETLLFKFVDTFGKYFGKSFIFDVIKCLLFRAKWRQWNQNVQSSQMDVDVQFYDYFIF